MTKALIDTNVLLDAIAARKPFRDDAEKIFLAAAQRIFDGLVTATSLTDIYYMARKSISDEEAREALRNLTEIFSVAAVSGADCLTALDSPMPDFEDALMVTCARRERADFIVTRDQELLRLSSPLTAVSPGDFIKHIEADVRRG